MRKCGAVALLGSLALLCSCAAGQRLTITTDPPGAQVTLIRYGITEAEGGVPGVTIGATGERFEDPPMILGTSPLNYEFDLVETAREVSIAGAYVNVKRKFTEGLVRAEKDGRVAERRVSFSGKPIQVDLFLAQQAE